LKPSKCWRTACQPEGAVTAEEDRTGVAGMANWARRKRNQEQERYGETYRAGARGPRRWVSNPVQPKKIAPVPARQKLTQLYVGRAMVGVHRIG
jgi:hypothetical protein